MTTPKQQASHDKLRESMRRGNRVKTRPPAKVPLKPGKIVPVYRWILGCGWHCDGEAKLVNVRWQGAGEISEWVVHFPGDDPDFNYIRFVGVEP